MSKHKPNRPDAPESYEQLLQQLQGIKPHKIVGCADTADFEERLEHLRAFAKVIDGYLFDLGLELRQHSNEIELKWFENRLSGDIEGNATFSIEQAIERAELEAA
jgi:DNA integrity scanning protein DisA with diadenylate cyclase activity